MKEQELLEEMLELSISERILLAESLWDSIVLHPDEVPMTTAQKEELDRRLAEIQRGEVETESWDTVKKRFENR